MPTVDRSPVLGLCGPRQLFLLPTRVKYRGFKCRKTDGVKRRASSAGMDFSAARHWISSTLHPSGFGGVPEVLDLTPFPASKSYVWGLMSGSGHSRCTRHAPTQVPTARSPASALARIVGKVNASSRYAGCDTLGHSPRRKNAKDSRRNRHTAWWRPCRGPDAPDRAAGPCLRQTLGLTRHLSPSRRCFPPTPMRNRAASTGCRGAEAVTNRQWGRRAMVEKRTAPLGDTSTSFLCPEGAEQASPGQRPG